MVVYINRKKLHVFQVWLKNLFGYKELFFLYKDLTIKIVAMTEANFLHFLFLKYCPIRVTKMIITQLRIFHVLGVILELQLCAIQWYHQLL